MPRRDGPELKEIRAGHQDPNLVATQEGANGECVATLSHHAVHVRVKVDPHVTPTVKRLTPELSDAGGPARPYGQPTWPARVRSSDFVNRFRSHVFCSS